MRVTSTQVFRKRIPRSGQILRRLLARVARKPRHLAWTLVLVERLLRRILPAMHLENMILARIARLWISRPHTLLLRIDPMRLTLPISLGERGVLHFSRSESWLSGVRVARSEITSGGRVVQFPALWQSGQASEREAGLSLVIKKRIHAVNVLGTTARRQHSHRTTGYASSPLQLILANRNYVSTRSAAESTAGDCIASRVVRQHRRVEDHALARNLDSEQKRAAGSPSPDLPTVVERPRPRPRRESDGTFVSAGQRTNPSANPDSAMNVAQITDAVLKQLDRRLVAARERMGRI